MVLDIDGNEPKVFTISIDNGDNVFILEDRKSIMQTIEADLFELEEKFGQDPDSKPKENGVVNHIKDISENPFNCFGRKPHRMDFDDAEEFENRLHHWERWNLENNEVKPI